MKWVVCKLLILGMGKKKVLIPADEVDLSAVKYEYHQVEGQSLNH